MKDQTENLNPTPEAVIAMTLYGKEYSEQMGGSMDFYNSLSISRQLRCADLLDRIKEAMVKHSHSPELLK